MTRTDEFIGEIEKEAESVRRYLPFASRAFVVELAGTPKSGKSTAVEAIRHFFKRQGFRVLVLTERAAVCPIPMKGHLFFNTWCATSMLAELLANVESETDLIIVDRGLLDSLVWMTMQEERGELTSSEVRSFSSFLLMERWTTLLDLAVVLSVKANEALKRETDQRITSKPGSIMNQDTLEVITESVGKTVEKYGSKFKRVEQLDTTPKGFEERTDLVRRSNANLALMILENFKEFLNPEVLVIGRKELERIPSDGGFNFSPEAVQKALKMIEDFGIYMRRSDAEINDDYVQIAPCAIFTHDTGIFLFERKEGDPKSTVYGKRTILRGCHANQGSYESTEESVLTPLRERLSSSLYLSRTFPLNQVGYCWDKRDNSTSRHFGIIYNCIIDKVSAVADLQRKEFRKQRGHDLSGGFVESMDLKKQIGVEEFEKWTELILQHCPIFK